MAQQHYHPVSRYIHWFMAAIFIIAWAIGFYSTEFMTYGVDANKGSVITLHKNIASTILFLVMIRIFWRYTHPAPKLPDTMSAGMKKMAHFAHYVLYFLLLVIPISGCIFSWSAGHPVPVLYSFEIPRLMAENKELVKYARPVHEYLSLFAGLVVLGHVLAALKHHFIDKDNVLRSMLKPKQ